jgi:hypothetical protein
MDDLDKASDESLVPDPIVAARYNVHLRTIKRWSEDLRLDFAPLYKINKRNFRRLGDLRKWERTRASGSTARKRAEVAEHADASRGLSLRPRGGA